MSNDDINKNEKEITDEIKSDEIETKTTITTIKNDKEVDYSKTIREGILDISSYTMLDAQKRAKFAQDLKKDVTMNEYVDEQCYTRWLKSNNPHVRAGIVYSYLYIKNFNVL